MSKLEIIYPERTPIQAIKAMDCGLKGAVISVRMRGEVTVVHVEHPKGLCPDGQASMLFEMDKKTATRFFYACSLMVGPAFYEEGERQP